MPTVYLLHFDRPLAHARHYLGSSRHLERRLAQHRRADPHDHHALMVAVAAAGIGFVVARTWPGGRALERQLKRRKEGPRLCPICREGRR